MKKIFTEYVRSLAAGGDPPRPEVFDRLWGELCRLLTWELKRRHLWSTSPSYLGVYGFENWTEAALGDLAGDCYVAVFLDRLRNLKAHAAKKPNIEGLVTLYVRHFVHATQKRCDPLGFKVFDVLRAALQRLLEEGSLHVLAGPENVRNSTVFGFSPDEDAKGIQEPFVETDLASWSDAILASFLTSRGETSAGAVERLTSRISELPERGILVFRFKDFVDPLKAEVRSHWGRILEDLRGETAAEFEEGEHGQRIVRFIALTQPETGFEELDLLDALRDCVDEAVRGLRLRTRTRDYLERFWAFLHDYARDVESENLPSHRRLSELLEIPRERFPELFGILSGLLEECRVDRLLGGQGTLGEAGSQTDPAGSRNMDGRTRREELRLRTGEALAGLAEPTPRIGGPQSGDLYLLDSAEDLEWLVLFRAAGGCLVVPADSLPFTGSRDVAVPRGAASGPLNLRCAFAVWVELERLETATRSGSLDAGSVAKARVRLDSESGLPAQRAVDRDPEYEDWTREVLTAGRDALRDERPRLPARRSSRFVPLALAAALFAAVVGLAVLKQQVESLGQPSFDVPRHDLDFGRPRDGTVLEVEPGSVHILLPLAIRRVDRYDHYFVEIIDERSERVWRSPIRERQTQYRLLVPRRLLPDGTYRFRLYGMRDGAEIFVGELERTFIERIDDP